MGKVGLLNTRIIKCFKKAALCPDTDNTGEDSFEGEEFQDVSLLLDRLNTPCTTQECIVEEDGLDVCQALVDSTDQNWRQVVRDHILNDDDVTDSERSRR